MAAGGPPRAGGLAYWAFDDAPNSGGVVNGDTVDRFAGHHLAQTASPSFIPSAQHGHAAVRFNGSSQQLKYATGFTRSNTHIWTVHKLVAWVNNGAIWSNTGSVDAVAGGPNSVTPDLGMYASSWAGTNSGLAVGTYGIVQWVSNGASSSTTVNGGTTQTINPGTQPFAGAFYLGGFNGASFCNVEIAAALVYDPTATGYSASAVLAALKARYGL